MHEIIDIVKKHKKAGALREFVNTEKKSDNNDTIVEVSKPELVDYPESIDGVILSFADRYPFDENLFKQVMAEW